MLSFFFFFFSPYQATLSTCPEWLEVKATLPLLTWVRHPTLGNQLRQQDAKRPHVRLDGELPVQRSLRGGPLDGELCTCRRAATTEALKE